MRHLCTADRIYREHWRGTTNGPQRFPGTRPRWQPPAGLGSPRHREGGARSSSGVDKLRELRPRPDTVLQPGCRAGNPEPVKELREKMRAYDAVLIETPEYDYAIPGLLTAALDWALRSRYDPTPFRHKPVGIVGASPGGGGTARGQMVLSQILLHPPAYVMPEPQMLIPFSRQKFDVETGDLVDEGTRERLRRFLEALAEWSERFEEPMNAHGGQTRERRA